MKSIQLLIFLVFACSQLFGRDVAIQIDTGKAFVREADSRTWDALEGDFILKNGSRMKTSRTFQGRLFFEDGSQIVLTPGVFYHFRPDGFYYEKQGQWYRVDLSQSKDSSKPLSLKNRLFGNLTPGGVVRITRPGQFENQRFSSKTPIYAGDIIELSPYSSSALEVVDGSDLQLKANSIFEVGTQGIFLKSGSVFSSIRKRHSSFEVTTPEAVVGVQGTVFQVSHQENTEVKVFEGLVRVASRSMGDRTRLLRQGERLRVRRGESLKSPARMQKSDLPQFSARMGSEKGQESLKTGENSDQKDVERIQRHLQAVRQQGNFFQNEQAVKRGSGIYVDGRISDELDRTVNPGEDPRFKVLTGEAQLEGAELRRLKWQEAHRTKERAHDLFSQSRQLEVGGDQRKKEHWLDSREANLSQSLRSKVQRTEFQTRSSENQSNVQARFKQSQELVTIRNFRNRKELEIKRLDEKKSRLTREMDLLNRKITTVESSIEKRPDAVQELRVTLVALRVQKRNLETEFKQLIQQVAVVRSSISDALKRQDTILNSLKTLEGSNRFRVDSRRRLGLN